MPALLDLGHSPEAEPEPMLTLLPVLGIDDAWPEWTVRRGTPFLRMRELNGRRYPWAIAGDTPDAVVAREVAIPYAAALTDILTGTAIRADDGAFAFRLPAPGVRVFRLDPQSTR
jgi:hypothetical protein